MRAFPPLHPQVERTKKRTCRVTKDVVTRKSVSLARRVGMSVEGEELSLLGVGPGEFGLVKNQSDLGCR